MVLERHLPEARLVRAQKLINKLSTLIHKLSTSYPQFVKIPIEKFFGK
ncbi:MAG: hypothetical protein V1855_03090 [bacterium]